MWNVHRCNGTELTFTIRLVLNAVCVRIPSSFRCSPRHTDGTTSTMWQAEQQEATFCHCEHTDRQICSECECMKIMANYVYLTNVEASLRAQRTASKMWWAKIGKWVRTSTICTFSENCHSWTAHVFREKFIECVTSKASFLLSLLQGGVKWNTQFSRWLNCVHVAMDKLCSTQNVISHSEWVK